MTEATKAPVSLASLMTPSKTVTIDFPGHKGMTVALCYLAREELVKLRKKCITTKYRIIIYSLFKGKLSHIIDANTTYSATVFLALFRSCSLRCIFLRRIFSGVTSTYSSA